MEQWIAFLQDKWYIIVIGLIVILLILSLVKTAVKWLLTLILIAVIVVYGYQYKDQLVDIKASLQTMMSEGVTEQAIKTVMGEAKDAKYTANPDGSFTIKSKNVQLVGKPGESKVKVTFLGQSFDIPADQAMKAFIEQAKANQ